MSLSDARMNAEARNHFIKDEQPIEPGSDVAQSLEEIATNRNRSKMAAGRLQNDTTDLRIIRQGSFDRFRIVGRNDDRVDCRLPGYAWNRFAFGRQVSAGNQVVMPAVKMTGELEDLGLTREDSSQAKGH